MKARGTHYLTVMQVLLSVVLIVLAVWVIVVVPYRMAERRGRRGWVHVLISLLVSPVVAIPLLLILGPA